MDPSYIFFKEIDFDEDKNFAANFLKENEYGVTGLNVNSVLPDKF